MGIEDEKGNARMLLDLGIFRQDKDLLKAALRDSQKIGYTKVAKRAEKALEKIQNKELKQKRGRGIYVKLLSRPFPWGEFAIKVEMGQENLLGCIDIGNGIRAGYSLCRGGCHIIFYDKRAFVRLIAVHEKK